MDRELDEEPTWLGITKVELAAELHEKHGFQRHSAVIVANTVSNLDEFIRPYFRRYWTDGTEPHDLSVEGYNFDQLQKDFELLPVAALTTLDWLIKDPERAKARLSRGYDTYGERSEPK